MVRSPIGSASSSGSGSSSASRSTTSRAIGQSSGGGRVVQHHLHVPAADPNGHEHLLDQADEADGTGVTRQSTQLDDQLFQVVGEVVVEADHVDLTVLAVGGDDEVDLVGQGVLGLVVVLVIVVVIIIGVVVGIVGLGRRVLVTLDVEVLVQPWAVVDGIIGFERLDLLVVVLRHATPSNHDPG